MKRVLVSTPGSNFFGLHGAVVAEHNTGCLVLIDGIPVLMMFERRELQPDL